MQAIWFIIEVFWRIFKIYYQDSYSSTVKYTIIITSLTIQGIKDFAISAYSFTALLFTVMIRIFNEGQYKKELITIFSFKNLIIKTIHILIKIRNE